jgi:protein-disulfide isomerase
VGEFGDKIAFVYRHFPLPYHQQADLAARTAESAGKQNKFWEMTDLLFTNQTAWADKNDAREKFISYAQSLGLDLNRFESDLDSAELKKEVENDYLSGAAIVNSTPTFFLNGKKIQNPRSYEEFRNLIIQTLSQIP